MSDITYDLLLREGWPFSYIYVTEKSKHMAKIRGVASSYLSGVLAFTKFGFSVWVGLKIYDSKELAGDAYKALREKRMMFDTKHIIFFLIWHSIWHMNTRKIRVK